MVSHLTRPRASRESALQALFIASAIIAIVVCGYMFRNGLSVSTDLRMVLPSGSANLAKVSDRLAESFGDRVLLALISDNESQLELALQATRRAVLHNPNFAIDLSGVERTAAAVDALLPHRAALLSPSDAQAIRSRDFTDLSDSVQAALFGFPSDVRWVPFGEDPLNLFGRYIEAVTPQGDGAWMQDHLRLMQSGDASAIFVLRPTKTLGVDDYKQAQQWFNELEHKTESAYDINLVSAGALFHVAAATTSARSEIATFALISILAIVALFVMVFRHIKPLLFAFASIGYGCVFALATTSFLFTELHIFTLVFGCSLIGVGVDYALHFLCMGHAANLHKLIAASLLACASTAMAYLFMGQSELAIVIQIAVFSALGLTSSWLFVAALYARVFDDAAPLHGSWLQRSAAALQHLWEPVTRAATFTIIGIALIGGLATAVYNLSVSTDLTSLYRSNATFVENDQRVSGMLGAFSATQFVLITDQSVDGILTTMHSLRSGLEQKLTEHQITGYQLLSDYIPPRAVRARHRALFSQVYATTGTVHSLVDLDETARTELARFATAKDVLQDSKVEALANQHFAHLWIGEHDGQFLAAITLQNPVRDLQFVSLPANATLINLTVDWATALTRNTTSALLVLLLTLAAIGLLLLIWLRQWQSLAIVLIPMTSSSLVLALLVALSVDISLFHVFGLYLVVGLGFDYAVFVYRDTSDDRNCFAAVLLSSLTTLFAFGLLSQSATPMISGFGVTIFCGTLLNLFLVPAIRQFRTHDPSF